MMVMAWNDRENDTIVFSGGTGEPAVAPSSGTVGKKLMTR
jgi:hypothetical protein